MLFVCEVNQNLSNDSQTAGIINIRLKHTAYRLDHTHPVPLDSLMGHTRYIRTTLSMNL